MQFLRSKISAIALVAAMLAAAGAPLFAAGMHPICAARQHDCGKTAKIAKCCCGDQGQSSNEGAPVQSRVQIAVDLVATPGPLAGALVPDLSHVVDRFHGSPPRTTPLDLPTLFSSLLI